MNNRGPEWEALPTQDKIVFELQRISEQLECLICLAAPELEGEEVEPVAEPVVEPELAPVAEPIEVAEPEPIQPEPASLPELAPEGVPA